MKLRGGISSRSSRLWRAISFGELRLHPKQDRSFSLGLLHQSNGSEWVHGPSSGFEQCPHSFLLAEISNHLKHQTRFHVLSSRGAATNPETTLGLPRGFKTSSVLMDPVAGPTRECVPLTYVKAGQRGPQMLLRLPK